jgi:hypothetical protein
MEFCGMKLIEIMKDVAKIGLRKCNYDLNLLDDGLMYND